jgi:hypothetical protein
MEALTTKGLMKNVYFVLFLDGCNIFMYDLFVEAIGFLLLNNLSVPTPVVLTMCCCKLLTVLCTVVGSCVLAQEIYLV